MAWPNPIYEDLPDGRTIRLREPYRRVVWCDGRRFEVVVPEGFESDLASIPRIFRGLLGQRGRFNRAALVHDWLYSSGRYSRRTADRVFRAIMEQDGVPTWKIVVMYPGVRVGAWVAWNKHRRAERDRHEQAEKIIWRAREKYHGAVAERGAGAGRGDAA